MYVTRKDKTLVNATSISTNGPPFITISQNIPHLPLRMLSHSDQCSYKSYKCEFSSYPHAGHINQQCIPCQPDLIHIPAGLLQGEPVVIKQDRYAELVKTQQVQQHGTKVMTREDWRVRKRCLFKNHHPQHVNKESK